MRVSVRLHRSNIHNYACGDWSFSIVWKGLKSRSIQRASISSNAAFERASKTAHTRAIPDGTVDCPN